MITCKQMVKNVKGSVCFGGGVEDIFSIFFNMEVRCVFLLESPHQGEYTQCTIFNIKKKITLNYPNSAAMRFF